MASPKTRPPRMSLGKWTYKYMRENAMSTASGIAIRPNFRFAAVRMVAPITEAMVCPEGNE